MLWFIFFGTLAAGLAGAGAGAGAVARAGARAGAGAGTAFFFGLSGVGEVQANHSRPPNGANGAILATYPNGSDAGEAWYYNTSDTVMADYRRPNLLLLSAQLGIGDQD